MKMNSLACIFPGQGSQSIGMLSDIADHYPIVHEIFSQASEILNYDLWDIVQNGPEEKINSTSITQPALLASSYAIWSILKNSPQFHPNFLAGHSLGEYSALACAQAISFEDAIKLVALRGKFMQEASPEGMGALAAIVGLDDNIVRDICDSACFPNEILSAANYNCPGQVVIAGHLQAVERAIGVAKEKGAKLAKKLPVSVPSHCKLMEPAALQLAEVLENITFKKPIIPVINNVDVSICSNPQEIRHVLIKQLSMPVRWVETISWLTNEGVTTFVECGPGRVLAGLNRRMAPNATTLGTQDFAHLTDLINDNLQ